MCMFEQKLHMSMYMQIKDNNANDLINKKTMNTEETITRLPFLSLSGVIYLPFYTSLQSLY